MTASSETPKSPFAPATGKAAPMTTTAHAEYAYSPRQGACSIAREHAILDQPISLARFRREAGDALCKPRRAFWGLNPGSTNEVSCPRCLELAKRYGVTLPQERMTR